MHLVRKRLSWLVAGWLVLQLTALCAAPVVLYAATISAEEAACDCPDAVPGQQCPMHHSHSGQDGHGGDQGDTARCGMRSALMPSDQALLVLAVAGPVPSVSSVLRAADRFETVAIAGGAVSSRPALPDAPPPRS